MLRAWSTIGIVVCAQALLPVYALAQNEVMLKPMQEGQAPAPAKPPVFSDKPYAEALAANRTDGKVFIVKATAEWCAPCKRMNRTTFVDPKVVKWFGDNGLVIEFDVDKDPKLAQELSISAMPTTVAFKGGTEFDRIVGYKDAEAFLAWLEGVKAGKKGGDDLQAKVEKARQGEGKVSSRERMEHARNLVQTGKLDEATDEYAWLWSNIAKEDPSMVGVRGSFLAGDIQRLIERHEGAKTRFAALRDEAWKDYVADPTRFEPLDDWIVLNEALDDDTRTLDWFDRAKVEPKGARTFERLSFRLERLLTDNNRIADISYLYPDPLAKLRSEAALRNMVPKLNDPEQEKSIRSVHDRMFRDRAAAIYTSLLLNKRDGDAAKFATEALKIDDTGPMRTALVRTALEHNAGRKEHHEWLAAADKAGEATDALKAQLEQQAGKP
jgi:thioredoxin 1